MRSNRDEKKTGNEEYTFLTETVKRRPGSLLSSRGRIVGLFFAVCMFLAAAGFLFIHFIGRRAKMPDQDYEPEFTDSGAEEDGESLILAWKDSVVSVKDSAGNETCGVVIAETPETYCVMYSGTVPEKGDSLQILDRTGKEFTVDKTVHDGDTGFSTAYISKKSISTRLIPADINENPIIRAGDSVIAITGPLGYSESVVYGKVASSTGILSVTDGEYRIVRTDIPDQHNGGILLNEEGEMIASLRTGDSPGSALFLKGISSEYVSSIKKAASDEGIRGYAGIKGTTITHKLSLDTGVPVGIHVDEVSPDSPALMCGLAPGDVIVAMSGAASGSMRHFRKLLDQKKPGGEIQLQVKRKGTDEYVEFRFTLTVGEQPV